MEIASPDVTRVAREWAEAGHARDGALLASLSEVAAPGAIHTIASPPDANLTLEQLVEHLGEVIPCPLVGSAPAGYMEGDFAWTTDSPQVAIPGEGVISIRITTVLHRADGVWRVVHGHLSEGVPHLEG